MRKFHLLLLSPALILGACSSKTTVTLEQNLKNPLFAERYSDNMIDTMVELKIQEDPLLEDEAKAALLERERKEWLQKASEASKKQREGMLGEFLPVEEFTSGEILYLENMLYFSTLFETAPGPDVRVMLTTAVDPRDSEFPEETTLDLGSLQSPYGSQAYTVPQVENPLLYRTVVLWDAGLERMYSFAQLHQ